MVLLSFFISFLLLLLLLLPFLSSSSSSTSTPSTSSSSSNSSATTIIIRRICSETRSTNQQSFDVNFVDSMEMISQSIAKTGFGIASSGDNSSTRVYGLGQCLNYLSNVDCRLCYAESRVKLPLCLPSLAARVYLDGCFLSYGNHNFSEQVLDSSSDTFVCGPKTSRRNSISDTDDKKNSIKFRELTNGLIMNLTSKAFEEKDYYKEEKVFVSSSVSVYGIAQCWKSVNKSGCKECLENARKSLVAGCLLSAGGGGGGGGGDNFEGRALNTGCFVKYSTDPFYIITPPSTNTTHDSSSAVIRRRLMVLLGSVLAAIVVIGGAFLWRIISGGSKDDDGSSEILRSISESQLGFKYTDLRTSTNDFNIGNKLGQGGFGSVYKGVLYDGREIAVKKLFFNTTQWVDQFYNEVNLISRVQHKNLVKLLGCSVDGPESLLVYEYLCNTSLDHFLFDSFRKKALDWKRRLNIIVGTAEGLAYLHEASEVRIIHRDIKASNVLLDEKFKPKIADFGLARYFADGQSHLSTGLAGTLGYMAPEYIIHGQLTEKADVYSYGVLVLEIVSGRKNTSRVSTSSDVAHHSLISQIWEHFTSKRLIEMLDPFLEGQCSEDQVLKVFNVGLLCTQASPNLRPPMWKVVEMLISVARDLPVPTQPPFINIQGVVEATSDGSQTSNMFSSASKSPVSVNQMSVSIMLGR